MKRQNILPDRIKSRAPYWYTHQGQYSSYQLVGGVGVRSPFIGATFREKPA